MIMNPMMKLDTSFSSSSSFTNKNEQDCSFWPIRTTPAATATTMASKPQVNENSKKKKNLSKVKLPFPLKLHTLLEDLEVDGQHDIACWLPNGKSFRINNPEKFSSEVMKNYFRQSKYTSFVRQLYIYGFAKHDETGCGLEVGAYYHPQFIKSNRSLCLTLGRNQIISDRRCKKNPNCKKTVVKVLNVAKHQHQLSASLSSSAAAAVASSSNSNNNSFTSEGPYVPDLSFSTTTNTTTKNNNNDIFDLSKIFGSDDNNDVPLPLTSSPSLVDEYAMFDLEPRPIEMMMSS